MLKISITQICLHNCGYHSKYKWDVSNDRGYIVKNAAGKYSYGFAKTLWGAKREARRYIKKMNNEMFEQKTVWEEEV